MTNKIPDYAFIPNSIQKYTPEEVTEKVVEVLDKLTLRVKTRGVNRAEWTYSPTYFRMISGGGDLAGLEFNLKIDFHGLIKTARNEK